MAGYKKFCEKCGIQCKREVVAFMGVKPDKFPRYKWICNPCRDELGGGQKTYDWLLPRFQKDGWKGTELIY